MTAAVMHRARRVAASALAVALLVSACGGGSSRPAATSSSGSAGTAGSVETAPAATPAPASATAPAVDARPRLVVLGDSLTAGLGLDIEDAYPTLLQHKLDAAGIGLQVVNAGISGDTSAGGLSRLDLALEGDVRLMLVALGGNDALRALPPAELRRNLAEVITRAQAHGVKVVLAGMEAPPNFGRDYTVAFREVFASLAREYRVTLIPFLLDGVAGVERLNQADGIHPTAEGARLVADHVWPVIEPLAREAASRPTGTNGEAARG